MDDKRNLYVGGRLVGRFGHTPADEIAMHDAFLRSSRRLEMLERLKFWALVSSLIVLTLLALAYWR